MRKPFRICRSALSSYKKHIHALHLFSPVPWFLDEKGTKKHKASKKRYPYIHIHVFFPVKQWINLVIKINNEIPRCITFIDNHGMVGWCPGLESRLFLEALDQIYFYASTRLIQSDCVRMPCLTFSCRCVWGETFLIYEEGTWSLLFFSLSVGKIISVEAQSHSLFTSSPIS